MEDIISIVLKQNNDILNVLQLFVQTVKFIRIRRQNRQLDDMFTYQIFMSGIMYLQIVSAWFEMIHMFVMLLKKRKSKRRLIKAHHLVQMLSGYRNTNVWSNLEQNWDHFFWLTGETPETLQSLVEKLQSRFVHHFHSTKGMKLDIRNQILLTMIWLRSYPTMQTLATIFGIHVSSVHRIIHKFIRLLHSYLVPKYIKWHSMQHWRTLSGTYPEWPSVVALLDCTPFRINKPKGAIQRIFYRQDRHCHFLNWLVIVDVMGYIVYSRPGFIGRTNDSACLRNIQLPVLPAGLHIMADQGFKHDHPVIVLPRANQPQISSDMRRSFKSRRSMIERCFGISKSCYSSAGCAKFRSRRVNGPILCNLCGALYNRRQLIFSKIRSENSLN